MSKLTAKRHFPIVLLPPCIKIPASPFAMHAPNPIRRRGGSAVSYIDIDASLSPPNHKKDAIAINGPTPRRYRRGAARRAAAAVDDGRPRNGGVVFVWRKDEVMEEKVPHPSSATRTNSPSPPMLSDDTSSTGNNGQHQHTSAANQSYETTPRADNMFKQEYVLPVGVYPTPDGRFVSLSKCNCTSI